MVTWTACYSLRLSPVQALTRAEATLGPAVPLLRKAPGKSQISPQGLFNKPRPAGPQKQFLKEEWRYQMPGEREPLPAVNALIVVEGINDMKAVARAVDAEVFVLGGAMFAKDVNTLRRLKAEARRYRSVVVLLDPDPAGRQGRAALDTALSHCRHGFVPGLAASAGADTRYHTAGNVGVEHCSPAVIHRAILCSQPIQLERQEFSTDDLIGWKLVTPMIVGTQGTNNAPMRRDTVGLLLGFGKCNGKQLLVQLNRYGVTRDVVEQAVAFANNMLLQAS